jgi:hypothetical protein
MQLQLPNTVFKFVLQGSKHRVIFHIFYVTLVMSYRLLLNGKVFLPKMPKMPMSTTVAALTLASLGNTTQIVTNLFEDDVLAKVLNSTYRVLPSESRMVLPS